MALWLMDHQMNLELTDSFGQRYLRLPLRGSPRIVCANALRTDWREIIPPDRCSYIKQRAAVETGAKRILEVRKEFPDSPLAALYDPLTMPPVLVKAHADLDRAVDRCYRREPFAGDRQRRVDLFWSARITDDYKALGVMEGDTVVWSRKGAHRGYECLPGR